MDQKTEEDGWRSFKKACLKVKSDEDLEVLFNFLLTPTERHEIAGRILIFRELLSGEKTQREIARDLGVSIANISRGSNVLKTTGSQLEKFLEK